MKIGMILKKIKEYNKEANIGLVEKAYGFAYEIHKDEKRASGGPFIEHPLNVAYMLAEMRMDTPTIIAGLLHDVVENSKFSIEQIQKEFGEEIASLVDGVTKISKLKIEERDERDAESIKKMLLATTKDLRVLIIKLVDKLHNMRTLEYLPGGKIKRISRGTLEIYAPLAYRIGMMSIKWELEDISFKYLEPEIYKKFKEKFGKKRVLREMDTKKIKGIIERELKKEGIEAEITGRPKHFYSIYRKMIHKNRSFDEIYDLIGLRIMTTDLEDCYKALGVVHNLWKPIQGEFKDYIAMPKENLYQSLHTAVIAPKGEVIEIQIRTEEMHHIAEDGIAAHWKYKGLKEDGDIDKKLNWMKQIIEWKDNKKDFMEFLKVDFFGDEIYVFTPKSKVIRLPKGSTPIDFAYSVHTSIGERCTGAIVDGRIVPLRYNLSTGDIVKILTSKVSKPKRDWLKIVKTTKAKMKIRQFLKKYENIQVNVPGKGARDEGDVDEGIIKIEGVKRPKIRIAKCCNPIPWEEIVGYATRTDIVSVHKKECTSLKKHTSRKKVKVKWKDKFEGDVEIRIIAGDRVGLFADILNTLATISLNVTQAKAKVIGGNNSEINLEINPENMDHLKEILDRIRKVKGIKKIYIGNK